MGRYQTTTNSVKWWAPIRVPDGAEVPSLTLEACDETAMGQIAFGVRRTRFDDGEDIGPAGGTGSYVGRKPEDRVAANAGNGPKGFLS